MNASTHTGHRLLERQDQIIKQANLAYLRTFGGKSQTASQLMAIPLGDRQRYRATIDHAALKSRFGCREFQLSSREATLICQGAEEARLAIIGGETFQGITRNLIYEAEQICQDFFAVNSASPSLFLSSYLITYQRLSSHSLLPKTLQFLEQYREPLATSIKPVLNEIKSLLHDKIRFYRAVTQLVEHIDFKELNYDLQMSSFDVDPLPEQSSETESLSTPVSADNNNTEQPSDFECSENVLDESSGDDSNIEVEMPLPASSQLLDEQSKAGRYHVYCNSFDCEIDASTLASTQQLIELRRSLDKKMLPNQALVQQLAGKLQRKLQTMMQRKWLFGQDEGILDASRLSGIVANPTNALQFKREGDEELPDTVLTLLIDNSGSMCGESITTAALCADILVQAMEKCNIKTEVLGFTTADWDGGDALKQWAKAGSPANPGRMSPLQHIIYKKAEQPWRYCKNNFGLMMRESMLKENIDGEALQWAAKRLLARPEQRRILMVISDGEPSDEPTNNNNPRNFLTDHLQASVRWIEKQTPIELFAIGVGHDVTRYYPHSITLAGVDTLGEVIIKQLDRFFDK